MIEQLQQTLGPHTEAFLLDEWLFQADVLAQKQTVVVRDWWPWLQAETVAEAQRRGLPIGSSPVAPGKLTSRLMQAVANIQREAQEGKP